MKNASNELFCDAAAVAGDEGVGVQLPRVLSVAGDARHHQQDLG